MVQEGDGKSEQIENLSGGEHSDNDPSLQPANTYRHSLNGNLVTVDGKNFSHESFKGTNVSFTLPTHIQNSTEVFVPIAMIPIRDILLILSTNDTTDGSVGSSEIGLVTLDQTGQGQYLCLYHHKDLRFTQAKMIGKECYGIAENDSVYRAYWCGDLNQPRTMNAVAPVWFDYYTSGDATKPLVAGQKYMVLTDTYGYITYDGTVYGPLQTATNVFTATSTTTWTVSGQVNVIPFVNPLAFDYTPQKTIDTIDFKSYAKDGQINAGAKVYAYRLYTKDGYYSSWSFTTNPIEVTGYVPGTGNGITSFKGQGFSTIVNTGKSVTLTINSIPADIFDYVQVCVLEMNQEKGVVTSGYIFCDTGISGISMDVTHYGNENLASILVDDLAIFNAVMLTAKTMTTTKQRQEIANFGIQNQVETDLSATTLTPFVYKFPADKPLVSVYYPSGSTYPNLWQDTRHVDLQASDIAGGVPTVDIVPSGIYRVKGIVGTDSIVYNSATYNPEDTFVGVIGQTTYTPTGTPIVKACIRTIEYMKWDGARYNIPIYKINELNNEYWGYSSMLFQQKLKGHWRLEKYRYGYLFRDKFGNPMFVKWLADLTMPGQSDAGFELIFDEGDGQHFSLGALGVQFDGMDITAVKDLIGGIEIVRCPRDKQIFAQGIIQQMTNEGADFVPVMDVRPIESAQVAVETHTAPYVFGILSPELDFGLPDKNPLPLISGDSIQPIADYDAIQAEGQPYNTFIGASTKEIYSKYYSHNKYTIDPSVPTGLYQLSTVQTVPTGQTSSIGGSGTFNNNILKSSGTHEPAGNDPVGSGSTALQNNIAVGGTRTVVIIGQSDIINQDTGKGTGTLTPDCDMSLTRKLLVNYFRPKSNLYGGLSDAAKANNLYISTGFYIAITPQLISDITNSSGQCILNGMQVFGGDCFVNIYDRVNALWDAGGNSPAPMSWGLLFPCESEINVAMREGFFMSANGLAYQDGVHWDKPGSPNIQQIEDMDYNRSYSSENDKLKYNHIPLNFLNISREPYKARYSQRKVLGEKVDNMRVFLQNNYENVDATHGEITKLIVGNDFLYALQEHGITYLPIEERELISAPISGATQLGVGGVMERADTRDMFYGCQHKHSVLQTENGFAWFDMERRAVVAMMFDGQVANLSTIKGKQSFFNMLFNANSNNLSDLSIDNPLTGYGILGFYDTISKTGFIAFKFDIDNKKSDITVGISNTLTKFIGDASFVPGITQSYLGFLLGVNENVKNTILNNTVYSIGNEVALNGVGYVCYLGYTSASPAIAPNSDTTHWKVTSKSNEISVFFKGRICKFFGVVYPYELTRVFGSNDYQENKNYDVMEVYGNSTAITDIYHQTSALSSSDTNIQTSNRNFKYIDNAWWLNVALSNGKQRMLDKYMITKLVVKNYINDPTTSLDKVKRIVYLRIINRFKK